MLSLRFLDNQGLDPRQTLSCPIPVVATSFNTIYTISLRQVTLEGKKVTPECKKSSPRQKQEFIVIRDS